METEAVQTTANIPIDDDKVCWEKEDHARHVWGIQVDPRRLFHFLCPGVHKEHERLMQELDHRIWTQQLEQQRSYYERETGVKDAVNEPDREDAPDPMEKMVDEANKSWSWLHFDRKPKR